MEIFVSDEKKRNSFRNNNNFSPCMIHRHFFYFECLWAIYYDDQMILTINSFISLHIWV